jgi:hypothetical protein
MNANNNPNYNNPERLNNPYTMQGSYQAGYTKPVSNPNNINTGVNQNQVDYTEYMKYANYYNPLIIQNYYAMFNQMNVMNPNMNNTQFNNYFSSPYTMGNNNRVNENFQRNQSKPYYNNLNTNNNFNNTFNNSYTHTKVGKPLNNSQGGISSTPELDEELRKWIESRKRNFPTKDRVDEKNTISKAKVDSGMLSKLELKLRQKVKILTQINGKRGRKFNNNNNDRRNNNRGRRRHNDKRGNQQPMGNSNITEGEAEEGEIVEVKEVLTCKQDSEQNKENENRNENFQFNKAKEQKKDKNGNNKQRKFFRYRKNKLYEELIKPDKFKELNVILQAFRYFVNENLV